MIGLHAQTEGGGSPELSLAEFPDPAPGPGELLVDIRATALNRADLLQVRGLYPPPPSESTIPGLECAGEVIGLGEGVTEFSVGDRVMALLAGGGHATKVAVPAAQAMPVPRQLGWAEAAALPEAALTSWTNLVVEGQLCRGQTCLITAAASGIGTFATQLARELGARVLVAGRNRERLEELSKWGSDGTVLLGDSFAEEVRELTDGQGVDLVMDLVGGEGFRDLLGVIRPRGRLVLVGLMAGPAGTLDLGLLMRKRLHIIGSVLRSRSREEKAGLVASFWEFAGERFDGGALVPVVDRVLPFDELPQAYAQMAEGGLLGKLVLRTDSASGAS